MSIVYKDGGLTLHHGSNKDVLPTFEAESFDSVVTDPPYELGFMGKGWDSSGIAYDVEMWRECWRVLKPGGFLLAFGGTRTWHRIATAIEDAGFEIRDSMAWLYGSGFPKSLDASKAIDKAAGAEREVIGRTATPFKVDAAAHRGTSLQGSVNGDFSKQTDEDGYRYTEHTAPATPDAARWRGWGTALKPAFEPIIVARKPLVGTVAANVLAYGTGAINIDATRIGTDGGTKAVNFGETAGTMYGGGKGKPRNAIETLGGKGRFPANVLLDESQAAVLDAQSGESSSSDRPRHNTAEAHNRTASMGKSSEDWTTRGHADSGGASRFFPTFRYEAKAPTSERPEVDGMAHATVKPLDLMRWLVRLVTRRGGHVLDPFAGSGTTGEAALLEGMDVTLIELEESHLPLILQRVRKPLQPSMFGDWEETA